MVLCLLLVLGGLPLFVDEAQAEAWTKNDMGQPYTGNIYYGLRGVAVGDGDRDDSNEVYVASYDASKIYQYTFTDEGWVSSDIATVGSYVNKVAVGDGDDDGTTEVYATGYGYIYPNYGPLLQQIYRDASGWHTNSITSLGYWTYNVAMGDGNNDKRTEIYTSDYYYGHIYQYSKGNTWDVQDLGNATNGTSSPYIAMFGLDVGDGDNDGKNEVYGSSQIGYLYRFAYDSGAWRKTEVGQGELSEYGETYSAIPDIVVGDADNDGKNEVYGVSWTNASVYRFIWNNSTKAWDRSTIALLGTGVYAYSIALGDADSDGRLELYAGTYKQVYKVWYDNKTLEWRSAGVGGGDNYMYDLAIGSATGDNTQKELYGACLDGHAYQFYTDRTAPANPLVSSDTHPVPGNWYNQSVVHVAWKDTGYDISGIDGYSFQWDKNAKTTPDETKDCEERVKDAKSAALADGSSWYFHIRARDNALNWNASAAHFGPICIDTAPPTSLSVLINDGAGYTSERKVTLSLNATDPKPGSGVAYASFSNDGLSWSAWEAFSAQRTEWDITSTLYGGNGSDGMKYVYVKVRDGAGNELKKDKWPKVGIFLDRDAPFGLSVQINGGAAYTTDATVSLGLDALDAATGIAKMAFSNDGVAWSDWLDWANTTGWSLTQGAGGSEADGDRSVFFKAMDRAGNIGGPVKDTIQLDRKAPQGLGITLNHGEEYATNATVLLELTASDPSPGSGLTEMALVNDANAPWTWEPFAGRVPEWNLTSGAGGTDIDGEKTVFLSVRDQAGNTAGPVNDTIFLDRLGPDPVALTVNGGAAYTTGPAVTLELTAIDPAPGSGVYAMQFSDDGAKWSDWEAFCSSRPYELPGGDGPKTVHSRVRDRAGNIGAMVVDNITLDTAPPAISNVRVLGLTDTSALIAWSTGEEADSGVDYGQTTAYGSQSLDPSYVMGHSVALKNLKASTTYHFRVFSKDRAGNPPSYSNDNLFTTAAAPDTTPPMLSNIEVAGRTDRLAVVGWSTNEPADGSVQYGKASSYGSRVSDLALSLKHSLTLKGLEPSTTYHFRVESKDSSGNGPAVSTDLTFTTLAAPDLLPPVLSNIMVKGITGNLAVVSWETDEPADSEVEFGNTTSYGGLARDLALAALHELTLIGLEPMTTYHFRVRSTDASGNGPSVSADRTFTTSALPDTAPPQILKVRAEAVTDSMAVISWETDEVADSFAEVGTTTKYGTTCADGAFLLRHSLLLQGHKPDTLYHFRVRSSDPSGNPASSADDTFTTVKTTPSPDRSPPVISGLQLGGLSDVRVVVMWETDELADSEVEYGTTMDYGLKASDPSYVRVHSILLEGLRPSTEYHLRARSTDLYGNGPSASADMRFVTASGPDLAPPAVSGVHVTNITNSSATITWLTDEPATSVVEFGADTYYGRNQTSRLFSFNHSVQLTGLAPGVIYHFRVLSTDPAGNPSAAGADYTFTTSKGPTAPVTPPPGGLALPFLSTDNPWLGIGLVLAILALLGSAYILLGRRAQRRRELEDALESPASSPGPRNPAPAATVEKALPLATPAALAPPSPGPVLPEEEPMLEPEGPAPERVETVQMESAQSGAAAAALARGLPAARVASQTPLRHIRCSRCRTRIPIYYEGPQTIDCPGCGKSGLYKPKG